MATRTRLPNRRHSETFELIASRLGFTCTYSCFADGKIGELFLSNHKTNSMADQLARDAAVVFSIAVQCGADPEVIRRALGRDARGNATSPLGVALEIIMRTQQAKEAEQ
jgi:hypothetical protein